MSELRVRHLLTLRAVERGDVYLAQDWEYRRRDAATARHVSDAIYMLERYQMIRLEADGIISITLRGCAWLTKRCADLDVTLRTNA